MPEEIDYGGDYYGGPTGDASVDAAIMQDEEEELEQIASQAAIEVKAPLLTRGDALRFAANFLAKQNFFASWIPISRLQQGALEEDFKPGKLSGDVLSDAHFTISWAESRDPVCPRCGCDYAFRGMHYWNISVVPEPGNIREQWNLGPGCIRDGAGKLLPPMILPKITGLIPPEWTKTRPEPGFSFSKALDIKRTFIGYTAKKIEEAGNRYYLYRTDGTEGQISKESYKQMEKLLQKAGESGLEEDHRALLEFVFSMPYIGIYDPEPRIIEG